MWGEANGSLMLPLGLAFSFLYPFDSWDTSEESKDTGTIFKTIDTASLTASNEEAKIFTLLDSA